MGPRAAEYYSKLLLSQRGCRAERDGSVIHQPKKTHYSAQIFGLLTPRTWHLTSQTSFYISARSVPAVNDSTQAFSSSVFLLKREMPDFPLGKLLSRHVYSVIVLEVLFTYLLILILFSTIVL